MFRGNDALNARIEYENALKALRSPGSGLSAQSISEAQCTQSYIRLEQPLNATTNMFTFPIQDNQTGNSNAVRPTERRLKLQDAFYVASINIYLAAASSATDYAFKLFTYPSPVTFASDNATLQVVYNGYWNLQVNGVTITPNYPMSNFNVVPITQLTAATNSPIDQFDGQDRNSLQPNPVLIGSNNNEFNVILPANIATIGTFRYMVVVMEGIKAQNVTVLVNGQ